MEMRIKQNARSAWRAHFSSFPKRSMHLSKTNYRSITLHTEPLRALSNEGQAQMIVRRWLKTYHLSIFTLVVLRELNNFTLVGSGGQNFFSLQVKEIPYRSVHNTSYNLGNLPSTVLELSLFYPVHAIQRFLEITYVCLSVRCLSSPPLPKLSALICLAPAVFSVAGT